MGEALKQHLSTWKLVYVWVALFTVGSLGSIILAALQGVTWKTLDGQTKFCIILAVLVNFSNTMGAFVSKAVARVQQGKEFIETGDSNPAAFVKKP